MQKIMIPRAGDHGVLTLQEAPDLRADGDQVVVATKACGVNYADVIVRMGLYSSAKEYVGWPITPGFEFSGKVIDIGPDVEDLSVGDDVFGVTRFGGYASQVCVPARQLFPLPDALSHSEAAAFPAVALTAYYALFELANLRPGQKVLIHSAAGGVGSMLVQLANAHGADTVGVVGASHKIDYLQRLGVDHAIDKTQKPLWQEASRIVPEGYDVILDANGVATLADSFRHLRPGGKLVVYGFHSMFSKGKARPNWLKLAWDWLRTPRFSPLNMTDQNKSVLAFNLSYLFDRTDLLAEMMARLLDLVEKGALRVPSVEEVALARVAEAHRRLESGQTVGKLVLLPGD